MFVHPRVSFIARFHRYEPWHYAYPTRIIWTRNPQTDKGNILEVWLSKYGYAHSDPVRLKLSFITVTQQEKEIVVGRGPLELYAMLDKEDRYTFFDIYDHNMIFLLTCDDFTFSFEEVPYDEM